MQRRDYLVRDNETAQRFELIVDDQLLGVLDYRDEGDAVALPHTEITPAARGRGWGAILVRAALDALRAEGKRVRPYCWYVAEFIEANPDDRDLLADPPGPTRTSDTCRS